MTKFQKMPQQPGLYVSNAEDYAGWIYENPLLPPRDSILSPGSSSFKVEKGAEETRRKAA